MRKACLNFPAWASAHRQRSKISCTCMVHVTSAPSFVIFEFLDVEPHLSLSQGALSVESSSNYGCFGFLLMFASNADGFGDALSAACLSPDATLLSGGGHPSGFHMHTSISGELYIGMKLRVFCAGHSTLVNRVDPQSGSGHPRGSQGPVRNISAPVL
jgi:hypothetical protein